ncbi:MAG TPA: Holliday junction branch migration protein RuvA [Polyangia bacterium]
MIASLRGVVLERLADRVVVEAGGVGYEVFVAGPTLAALPPDGSEVRLAIHTHAVKDGGLQLFGFGGGRERAAFELLIEVQGVGPKVALQVLSGMPVGELCAVIGRGDVARLCAVRGIGRKTAERLVMELKDKVQPLAGEAAGAAGAPAPPALGGVVERAAQALQALGYKPGLAERAARAAAAALPDASLEALVREALRQAEVLR